MQDIFDMSTKSQVTLIGDLITEDYMPMDLGRPLPKLVWQNSRPIDYSKVLQYANIGKADRFWYRDCTATFEKLFGVEELPLVCKIFAATSINTSLKANITLFRRGYYEIKNNLPFGAYLPNIKNQLELIRQGKDLSGRKISNFAKAMAGDSEAVVVDIHLLRAYDQERRYWRNPNIGNKYRGSERSGGASDKQYTLIENHIRENARLMGYEPRELCAMIWAGCRIQQTGDRTTRYCDILTAKLTNLFGVI